MLRGIQSKYFTETCLFLNVPLLEYFTPGRGGGGGGGGKGVCEDFRTWLSFFFSPLQ